jgi:hypothetical protein
MITIRHHAFMAEIYDITVREYFAVVNPNATLAERVVFYSEVLCPAVDGVGASFHNMADRSAAGADYNATQMAGLAVLATLFQWMENEMPILTGYCETSHREEIVKNVKKVLVSG